MENIKNQVIFIRGGENFDSKEEFYNYLRNRKYDPYKKKRSWRDWLAWGLSEDFDAFVPDMPNKQWADYEAWKIWFEKVFPYINKDKSIKLIMVGNSPGSTFLVKYLSESRFPKRVDQLHLVSPAFDDEGLIGEKLGNFKFNPANIRNIEEQVDHIFLYHSVDDDMVPFEHSQKFLKYFKKINFMKFEDRGHFKQPAFMEILQNIKNNL